MSNSTVVSRRAQGTVCVARSNTSDLIVDVNSDFRAGSTFNGQNSKRLLDTRHSSSVAAGQQLTLNVAGQASVPSGASTAAVNISAG